MKYITKSINEIHVNKQWINVNELMGSLFMNFIHKMDKNLNEYNLINSFNLACKYATNFIVSFN